MDELVTDKPAKGSYDGQTEAEFLEEARTRFQEGVDQDRENREAAEDDLEFVIGNQWDEAQRKVRTDAGRPCLTVNRMPQFIAQVVGDIRINRPAIRVRPAEDADKKLADMREGLIRAIERDCDAQGVYATAGQCQVACGIGNFRVSLKYASDEAFERDIDISAIPDPLSVVWDPFIMDGTGRDARYCFVPDDMPKKDFERKYGKEDEPVGELLDQCQKGNWWRADSVRVTEYWLMKETPIKLALLEDGSTVEVKGRAVPEGVALKKDGKPYIRETFRRSACMYLITGHKVLAGPYEYPISRVPVLRVPGWEVSIGKKRVRFGLVRFAKDPQRLLNYWRSVSAEVLALAPKQQWLLHEQTLGEGGADEFEQAHRSGRTVLAWSGQVPPQRVEPPPVNAAVLQEAQLNSQDMKDVTGLHDASLGIQSNETSGKAILARQREGDVATYVYHDNLQAAIREAGRIVNELIPTVYDTARTIRVIGEDGTTTPQRINDPNHPENVDINQGKYDVVVEVGPSYSTKRQEASESMMQFVQAVPQAAAVVADLIAKVQDWPMSEEIAERLRKVLPPGIAKPEEGEEQQPPNPAMIAQQQAQQMQGQLAQVELQTKQAMQRTAEANAAKAEAEAGMAQRTLNAPPEMGPPVDPVVQDAERHQALASAAQAHFKAQSDLHDLQNKPTQAAMETAHSEADLDAKLNPDPEPVGA